MNERKQNRDRILIADDDPISRRILESFLLKWDYQVIAVSDGMEALKVLEREDPPSLAVLDWMMPGMEGPQVCRRMRDQTERAYVYILLLTARSEKRDLLQGLESGADDYLTKPFDAQELRARLHVGQRILDLQESLIAARDEVRFHATHDALTGLANRRAALEAMNRERSRQVRGGGSFGVVLADLDHFKQINDTHGHLCGDAVLKEAAQRMSSCVRSYDTVGRYGGEEFLIIVPSSDGSSALALAERVRRMIESKPIITEVGNVQITASFGVAVSTPEKPLEPPILVRLADEALYQAKQKGRNRSELSEARASGTTDTVSTGVAPLQSRST